MNSRVFVHVDVVAALQAGVAVQELLEQHYQQERQGSLQNIEYFVCLLSEIFHCIYHITHISTLRYKSATLRKPSPVFHS